MHLLMPSLPPTMAVEDAQCIFHCPCCRPQLQWNMHTASSTAHVIARICSGRCTMHLPLPILSQSIAVEDTQCIFHCTFRRPQLQWKMHHASSNAQVVTRSGSGMCTMYIPMPMLLPVVAVEDAQCIFHCKCCRPQLQWTMHAASSTAHFVAHNGSGRCTVHLPLPVVSPTVAMEDAQCSFHCPFCRPQRQWNMHNSSSTAHVIARSCSG